MLPVGRRVGVLTAEKEALTPAHFTAVGCPTDLPVVGMPPDGVFKTGLRKSHPRADVAAQRREAVQMAHDLVDQCPDIGAIVCECTNLAPHSAAIAAAVGLPVYDVVTMVNWLHAGIQPTRFID
jgi:phosphohistidine swiveling domain-containing protein